MSKAAVTGGAGFVGSHIVDELIKNDFEVVVIDNLPIENINNLNHLRRNSKMSYIQASVNDLTLMQKQFSSVDYVFHFAAIPYTRDNFDNPISYYEANSKGTLCVLQAAKDNGVKKVILASSSAVYGNEPTLPKKESMIPEPSSPYAITKVTAEMYCSIFQRVYNLQTLCLRYFNIYGPRQNPNSQLASVIPKFIQKVNEGKSPVIFGDGTHTRDFVFVGDVARASLLAAISSATGIYNIGTGKEISLNEIAQTIIRLMGRNDIRPVYEGGINNEIKYSVADISKAQDFGYEPHYSLEQGLKKTIETWNN